MTCHRSSLSWERLGSWLSRGLLACSFFLLPGSWCAGQEITWRTDYQGARREAAEKNKPLVIDVGTENCTYCRKLDATTFRDPVIVGLMNERFIPLRLDAGHDPNHVAEKLGIQAYPTIVFAAPDGKIVNVQTGYITPVPLQEQLQQVLAVGMPPEWMTRDYQLAAQAIAGADYASAITLLKTVTQDGKDRPVQLKARQLLQELEEQAAGRLARARQLVDKGQNTEARETTNEVVRVFSGTQAAVEASRLLSTMGTVRETVQAPHGQQAQDLLARAQQDFRTQRYLACLNRCETLSSIYSDTPEAIEAGKLANEIKGNPEWMRQACDNLSDQLGLMYLTLAESWLRKGQPQQAALCLERVVQTFPGSQHAEMAQVRLTQIQGQPARPLEKP